MSKIALDIGDGFRAQYVKPGTTYIDEPTEEIDPGWYVTADRAWDEDGLGLILKVEEAWDAKGHDAREAVAKKLAAVLGDHFGGPQ